MRTVSETEISVRSVLSMFVYEHASIHLTVLTGL